MNDWTWRANNWGTLASPQNQHSRVRETLEPITYGRVRELETKKERLMRSLLLFVIGIPLPIIILIWLFTGHM